MLSAGLTQYFNFNKFYSANILLSGFFAPSLMESAYVCSAFMKFILRFFR